MCMGIISQKIAITRQFGLIFVFKRKFEICLQNGLSCWYSLYIFGIGESRHFRLGTWIKNEAGKYWAVSLKERWYG